jgi:outer membrane protein insertion porin family
MKIFQFFLFSLFLFSSSIRAQTTDLTTPKQYEIANITIVGVKYFQPGPIISKSGLKVGNKITIPGPDISQAIDKLWKEGLFSDVQIYATKIEDGKIYLSIELKERPRLNNLTITGLRKNEIENIKDEIKLPRGSQITDNAIQNARFTIKKYFTEKGFYNVDIEVTEKPDSSMSSNLTNLTFKITTNKKIKIRTITFTGNDKIKSGKLHRSLKDTKQITWYNLFKRSKYIPQKYQEDKKKLLSVYKKRGYRDIEIIKDTVYQIEEKNKEKKLKIDLTLKEGEKYYFRKITFIGNTKYNASILSNVLGIKRGDVYNEELLTEKISGIEGISSLYLDNGYLFFNAEPVEKNVDNDSIDIEVRMFEGRQATINRVTFTGNTKTKDKVIMREIRTLPGELFSRADIIRTQRELAQLGYFDPEKMNVEPKPNPEDGTVDINYIFEEKSNDQVELSGGWSGKYVVLSSRLILNNISLHDMFTKGEWPPLGDGQNLALNITYNPQYYQLESATFTEPWLGGKKPNSLAVSIFRSVRLNSTNGTMRVAGASTTLGRRLKWPDDYFTLSNEVSYQNYKLNNYSMATAVVLPTNLIANNFSFITSLGRNCIDQPLYPRSGSNIVLSMELTPPYSLVRNDPNPTALSPQDRYKWIEYHKWKVKVEDYISIVGKLVLQSKMQFGFLGYYNKNFKSPFEGFNVGGDGMSNMYLYGVESVPLRGYTAGSITPTTGGNIYDRLTLELRYPLTLNQSATIYGVTFAEAGNAWTDFKTFDPYNVKRSAGLGIRIFLPMMGLLGFDYGYGFDAIKGNPNANGWQPSFILGQQF